MVRRKQLGRPLLMLIACTVVLGAALTIAHYRSSRSNCNDNGVIGYCCQHEQRKQAQEGKPPEACPG